MGVGDQTGSLFPEDHFLGEKFCQLLSDHESHPPKKTQGGNSPFYFGKKPKKMV